MKSRLLILLGLLNFFPSFSQSPAELENKYWNYRDRLQKYFVQIGPGAGQSIPAASIFTHGNTSDTFRIVNGQEVIIPLSERNSYNGKIGFGDATLDQGWYIAVLASEYWLLKHKGLQNTDKFKALCNELYFALAAVDRVDNNAEPYLKYDEQQTQNGFFIRSDHATDFLKYFRESQISYQPIENLASGGTAGPEILFIDTTNGTLKVYDPDSFRINLAAKNNAGLLDENNRVQFPGGPGQYGSAQNLGNEMSQDQVYGLMLGFKAIAKWVDADLVVWPNNNPSTPSKNIVTWTKEITDRIMDHVSQTRGDPIYIKDENDYLIEANKHCEFVYSYPYIRHDTSWLTTPDTIIIPIFDSSFNITGFDTTLIEYYVKDTVAATAFAGSTLRTCDPYDYIENHIKKRSGKFFKESNYIITNPVRNGNPVTRGHYAIPFSYPLKTIAEDITGETYPEPSAKLKAGWQVLKYGTDIVFVVATATGVVEYAGISIAVPAALVSTTQGMAWTTGALQFLSIAAPGILNMMGEDAEYAQRILTAFSVSGCNFALPSLDLVSTCMIGYPLLPAKHQFWEHLWHGLGTKNVLMEAMYGKNPSHMVHNLAVASGTWEQNDFNDWADHIGFDYSDILFSMFNDKTPIKSRTYYENALNAAQCQGPNHPGGHEPTAGGDLKASEPLSGTIPFHGEHLFSTPSSEPVGKTQYAKSTFGLDYMLMYNLFRMADELHWGSQTDYKYVTPNCPCAVYPALPYTSPVRSILEKYTSNHNFTIEGRAFNNRDAIEPITVLNGLTENISPIYDYYSNYNIRIPNFLLHNLEIRGFVGTLDTARGRLNIEQDLTICHGLAEVKNYGEIEVLTNTNPNFPSILSVSNEAVLDVYENGVIRINNNVILRIENNGKLKFRNGARIILNGPNAVLHIKGVLELGPGAHFEIEGGPAGKGYVIWDNGAGSPHYGKAELIANTGSTFTIKQSNANVLGLQVEGTTGFVTPFTLAKLNIKNCRVNLGPASQLVSQADSTIVHNVQVKGYFGPHANPEFNYKATAKGLHQLGKRNSYNMVTISECATGLTVFNLGTSEALNMQDVYFENCLTAIHNRGGRIKYKDGNVRAVQLGGAYMDLRNGIKAEGVQGASMLENVELSARHFPNPVYHPLGAMEQTHNVKVHGAGNYYFYKSKIQFADYGSKMDQAGLLPVCSEIFDNTTQLQHTTWSKFVAVNQAWNHIHWPTSPAPSNPKKMYFGYMSYLYLDKGQNQIMSYTGGLPNLQALLATDQNITTSTDALKWNTNAIPASQNQWQTAIETQPAANYNAIVEQGFPLVSNLDLNKMPVNTSNWQTTQANYCMNLKTPFSPRIGGGETESDTGIYGNGVGNGERRMPVSPADLGTMLTGQGQNGAAYVQSLRRVLRAMDMQPPNYGAIVDTFAQLLTQPLPDTVSAAVKHVYGLLQDFYLEVRTDGFIPEQDRLAQEQLVFAKMLALQNQLLVLSTDTNSIWHIPSFELTRDKALLYRVFNQRTEAIAFLDTKIPSWQPLFEKEALEVWKCLLTWEQSYIDGQVTYDSLIAYSCVDNLAAANNNLGNRVDNKKTIGDRTQEMEKMRLAKSLEKDSQKESEMRRQFELYPNPAENTITIKAKSGIVSYKIYETNGRLVVNRKAAGETGLEVNIENLVRGTYIVEIESKTATYRTTLVVNR